VNSKPLNILQEWGEEDKHSRIKFTKHELYNFIFVAFFLATLFFCLAGIVEQACLALEIGPVNILSNLTIPAWGPAALTATLMVIAMIGLKKENGDSKGL